MTFPVLFRPHLAGSNQVNPAQKQEPSSVFGYSSLPDRFLYWPTSTLVSLGDSVLQDLSIGMEVAQNCFWLYKSLKVISVVTKQFIDTNNASVNQDMVEGWSLKKKRKLSKLKINVERCQKCMEMRLKKFCMIIIDCSSASRCRNMTIFWPKKFLKWADF